MLMKVINRIFEGIGAFVVGMIFTMYVVFPMFGFKVTEVNLETCSIVINMKDQNTNAKIDLKEMEVTYTPDIKGYFEELIGR